MSRSLLWEDLANGCSKQGVPWCKNDLDVTGHGSWNELREGEGGGELGGGQVTEGFKELRFRISLVVQWLRLRASGSSTAGGMRSIPGWELRSHMSRVVQPKEKKKKNLGLILSMMRHCCMAIGGET